MKKKVISFILCFIMSISLIAFNKVGAKAEDSSIDYSDYYIKNYEEELEDEKYIVIDNDEDLKEMEKYDFNWGAAVGFDIDVIHRNPDYPYSISFVTQNNLAYDDVKEILSKYDTKFLFGYTYSKDYLFNILKKYLDTKYTQNQAEKLYSNFKGGEEEFLEYLKHMVVYNYFSTAESYSSTIRDIYSVDGMNRYWYGESEYYVRFANEEDYQNARKEFEGNENIEISGLFFGNLEQIKENSIIVDCLGDEYHVNISIDELKEELREYSINYTSYSSYNGKDPAIGTVVVLSDINNDNFDEVLSVVKEFTEMVNEYNGGMSPHYRDIIISEDNKYFVLYNVKETGFVGLLKPKDRTSYSKYLKLGYKNSDKYVITKNADTFFNSLNENSEIYPVENIELKTIYRLYNKHTGEHLFTSKKSEYDKLEKKGWTKEGETFNGCNDKDAKGVYRVYNPNAKGGDHHYTMSQKEAENLVKKGWKGDNEGNPLFYAAGDKKVYRLYNRTDGRHHYTPKVKEKEKLVGLGWVDEGVAWETLE